MAQLPMFCPPTVAPGESARLIFAFAPTVGTDAMTLKVYTPGRAEADISANLRPVVAASPSTLSFYVADVAPGAVGDWYYVVTDATSGDWGACMVSVRQWAGNMDTPVSDIAKQRVDIDRLRTNIRNQGGR